MMKYKLLKNIKNTFFDIANEEYLVLSEKVYDKSKKWIDTLIVINGNIFEESVKTYMCNFNGGGILNKKLYYIESEGESFVIDLINNVQDKFLENEFIGFKGFFKDKILIKNHTIKTKSNWEITGQDFMAMIDGNSKDTIWTTKKLFSSPFLSDEKTLYVVDVNCYEIRCLDANTGIDQWSFPVNELGKYKPNNNYEGIQQGQVNRLITIHQGVLIAQITDYNILSIDINTGKKKWIINDFRKSLPKEIYKIVKPMTAGDTSVGDIANWHLIPETNKMYLTWFSFVFELDIITKEIKVIFNAFAKSMTLGRSIRIENLIYILGVNDIYLHIFDIEKRGIIWSFMHPEKTRINDISIYKDKIYLKDWNDNLLILEREE